MAISIVSFLFSRAAQLEAQGPTLLGAGFLYRILSPTGLQTQSRVPRAPSAGWWLSLPYLLSNSSDLQLTDFLSSPSYIIVQSSTQYLWNGMFDRHQVEITVMQFTGHSLLVHQSISVPWDFTRFLLITAIRMCHFLLMHHFGMTCLAGSKVNIQHLHLSVVAIEKRAFGSPSTKVTNFT